MGIVATWAAGKGLELAEDGITNWLQPLNADTLLRYSVDEINDKLDIVIAAPFKQAVMHLKAGDIEKASDKLIEAISLNELDLPAMLLYCGILRSKGKFDLALEYYFAALESFGNIEGSLPPGLFEAYRKRIEGSSFIADQNRELEIKCGDYYYPELLYFCPFGIVTRWEERGLPLFYRFLNLVFRSGKPCIGFHSWEGRDIFKIEGLKMNIHAVTPRYVVIENEIGTYPYRLADGTRVPYSLDDNRLHLLFPNKQWSPLVAGGVVAPTRYGNALGISSDYSYVTSSTGYSPGPHGMSIRSTSTIKHIGGMIIVKKALGR